MARRSQGGFDCTIPFCSSSSFLDDRLGALLSQDVSLKNSFQPTVISNSRDEVVLIFVRLLLSRLCLARCLQRKLPPPTLAS